jgi:hypothetical protein
MSLELAITICNNNHEPIHLNVEPLGEDYTLLPGDEFEIWEETDPTNYVIAPGYHGTCTNRTIINEGDNVITIYEFFDYEVQSKGKPIPVGYQRDWSSWKETNFSIETAVQPREVFDCFKSTTSLSSALGYSINKEFSKKWITRAANGRFEWRVVRDEAYSLLYLIWRAEFFPSTSPDSHARITFKDLGKETEINVQLTSFDNEITQQKAADFWRDEILQPILYYCANENSKDPN